MRSGEIPVTDENSSHVKAVFEEPLRYLKRRRLDITLRAETVRTLAPTFNCTTILDIGCGDGCISVPLVNHHNHLTLLDFSSSMAGLARSRVPPDLAGNVDVRNEDFMKASFGASRFTLIICLGVIAHVDSAANFFGKVSSLLAPGGHVIFEFTDAYHFGGRISRLIGKTRELVAPPRSSVQLFAFKDIVSLLAERRLEVVSSFRYGTARPGLTFLAGYRIPPDPFFVWHLGPEQEPVARLRIHLFGYWCWSYAAYLFAIFRVMIEGRCLIHLVECRPFPKDELLRVDD